MDDKNLRAAGDRIEGLLQEFGSSSDPSAKERAQELVRLLMELYGAALGHIVDIVAASEEEGVLLHPPLRDRLVGDPLVASLLLLHGLHPLETEARIERALESVRPYLGSHGGNVVLLSVADGVARLRLEGTCNGCGSSTVTMKLAVGKAIEEAAPEVTRIEVEGVPEPPPKSPLIQLQVPKGPSRGPSSTEGWTLLEPAPTLAPSELHPFDLAGEQLVLCRVGDDLFAYRNTCPSCRSSFRQGVLHEGLLACGSCGRRYDIRLAGHCLDADLQLDALPLLSERGRVRIAVSGGA